jgi:hypothetical protein
MSKLFYVASGLANADRVGNLVRELESYGWTCTYDWTLAEISPTEGSVGTPEEKEQIAWHEINGVIEADIMVLWLPGGRGAHVELGAALSSMIPVLLVYDKEEDLRGGSGFGYECIFYLHERVTKYKYTRDMGTVALVHEMDQLYAALLSETEDWVASKGG